MFSRRVKLVNTELVCPLLQATLAVAQVYSSFSQHAVTDLSMSHYMTILQFISASNHPTQCVQFYTLQYGFAKLIQDLNTE